MHKEVKIKSNLYNDIDKYCQINSLNTEDFISNLLSTAFTSVKYQILKDDKVDKPKPPKPPESRVIREGGAPEKPKKKQKPNKVVNKETDLYGE